MPNQRVQRLKEISDVMNENTRRIFFGKKAALEAGDEAVKEQVASGKDIMSILRKHFIFAHCITSAYSISY